MGSEKKFIIKVTAKELVDLKINSITSAKRWIERHDLSKEDKEELSKKWSVERLNERSVESIKTVDNDRVDNKESVGGAVSNSVGNVNSYQPEPVEKPEFDFKGLSQTEDEVPMSSGEYFRKKNGSSIL